MDMKKFTAISLICAAMLAVSSCDSKFSWKYGFYNPNSGKYHENTMIWSPNLESRLMDFSANCEITKDSKIRIGLSANHDNPRWEQMTDLTRLYNLLDLREDGIPYMDSCDNAPEYIIEANRIVRDRQAGLQSFMQEIMNQPYFHFELLYVFMTEAPTVTSDLPLFGRAAGEDLSDLFIVNHNFLISDLDLNRKRVNNMTMREYFSEGTMLAKESVLLSASFPQELNEYDVNLSFTFPVVEEYYWDYCLDLAKGKNAEERLKEGYLTFSILIPRQNQ